MAEDSTGSLEHLVCRLVRSSPGVLSAGGLLASINSYAQLFETLTEKASALEGQKKKALAEHAVVRCVRSGRVRSGQFPLAAHLVHGLPADWST